MNSKSKSPRKRVPRSEVRKIYSMYESGVTVDVIQALTARARSTIYRVINIERKRRALLSAPVADPIVVPKQEEEPKPHIPASSFTLTFLQRAVIWFAQRVGVTEVMYWTIYTEKKYGHL